MAKESQIASKLFTIGYEKAKPDAVMAELKRAKVKLLVDTRAVAASRKPGFSKRQLAAASTKKASRYLHLQKLGTPAEGRAGRALRQDRHALAHLRQAPQDAGGDRGDGRTRGDREIGPAGCLLCYERDKDCCHRSRIAEIVHERTGASVVDLVPRSCSERLFGRLRRPEVALDAVDQERHASRAEHEAERDHRGHRSTRSKPPRLCRNAIMVMAAPEITIGDEVAHRIDPGAPGVGGVAGDDEIVDRHLGVDRRRWRRRARQAARIRWHRPPRPRR